MDATGNVFCSQLFSSGLASALTRGDEAIICVDEVLPKTEKKVNRNLYLRLRKILIPINWRNNWLKSKDFMILRST